MTPETLTSSSGRRMMVVDTASFWLESEAVTRSGTDDRGGIAVSNASTSARPGLLPPPLLSETTFIQVMPVRRVKSRVRGLLLLV